MSNPPPTTTSTSNLPWTATEVKTLIKLVKISSFLYDETLPRHSDQKAIEERWLKIANTVGLKTVVECRNKWSQITSQLYRIEQSRVETNSTPQWVHYEALSFMIPFIKKHNHNKRKTESPPTSTVNHDVPSKILKVESSVSSSPQRIVTVTQKPDTFTRPIQPVHVSPIRQMIPSTSTDDIDIDFPANEPSQFFPVSAEDQKVQNSVAPIEVTSPVAQLQPPLPQTPIEQSNEHFMRMVCAEMGKLPEQSQSRFRINVLMKLHEMVYRNTD